MPTVIIRSLMGRAGTVVVGVLIVLAALVVRLADGASDALSVLGWGSLLLLGVWALWYAPQIDLTDRDLVVRNAWRTHTLSWDAVLGCRTRWALEVMTKDGFGVRASAAQRPGGLLTSLRERQALREKEAFGGKRSSAIGHALAHRGVRGELLDPGEGTYRVHLDSDAAGDLIEAYLVRRDEHEKVLDRARRRSERLARRDGQSVFPESDELPEGGAQGASVVSRLNLAPVAALALCVLLLLAVHLAG